MEGSKEGEGSEIDKIVKRDEDGNIVEINFIDPDIYKQTALIGDRGEVIMIYDHRLGEDGFIVFCLFELKAMVELLEQKTIYSNEK